jgi:predicted aldo/keto reductase-like oxidoreductase
LKQFRRQLTDHLTFLASIYSGLKVSAFGLGSYITYGMQVTEEDKIFECFNTAFNAGVNLFDTAEVRPESKTASRICSRHSASVLLTICNSPI